MRLGSRASGRAAAGLLTVAAVAVGLAASLGAGYTVAESTVTDSSTYATKGSTVVHVNGESRRVDGTVRNPKLAKDGETVETVDLPGGGSASVNKKTGVVTTVNGSTMSPTKNQPPTKKGGTPYVVVRSGDVAWLVDHDGRSVQQIVLGHPQRRIKVGGSPVDAAPAPRGALIVLLADGTLARVARSGKIERLDAPDGRHGALTVAGDHTYLVTEAGVVVQIDGPSPAEAGKIDGVAPDAKTGAMLVGSVRSSGTHVLVVSAGTLSAFDPGTGKVVRVVKVRAPDPTRLGEPVEYRGVAYVPDYKRHKVVAVSLTGDSARDDVIDVPGTSATFELFVAGGKLWMNDQYAQRMLEIDGRGSHKIDKGSGDGTKGDPAPKKPSPPSRPSAGGPGPGDTGTRPADTPSGSGDGKPRFVRVPRFDPNTDYRDYCATLQGDGLNCTPVSSDEKPDGIDGEVIRTAPGANARVPVGSSVVVTYVGPPVVPKFDNGTTPAEACRAIQAARLKCGTTTAASEAASDPGRFGTVADTVPAGGTTAKKGDMVDIRYYDRFTMPNYRTGRTAGARTCGELQNLAPGVQGQPKITCTATPGQNVTRGNRALAGVVYKQSPKAGTTYRPAPNAPIRLTVYSSQAQLPDYRLAAGYGNTADAAVQECSKLFDCSLGQPVVASDGTNPQPGWTGKVAAMKDGNGGDVAPGPHEVGSQTKVVIIPYTDQSTVPDVTNQSTAGGQGSTACNTLHAAGFQCDLSSRPVATNTVNVANPSGNAQQPVAGTPGRVGDTVVVPNSPWALVALYAYRSSEGDPVWTVRLQTAGIPGGYGPTSILLGFAYPAGGGPPGTVQPHDYYCPGGPLQCNGWNSNHMYTLVDIGYVKQHDDNTWKNGDPDPAALLPKTGNACGPGQNLITRTWKFSDIGGQPKARYRHTYSVINTDPGPVDPNEEGGGQERLGCVWQGVAATG